MNSNFFDDQKLIQKDPNQFEAYNSMSNTVVIAGPGSGKTKVLALKAVTLAKTSVSKPSGIACISYSRETVRELKKRLQKYGYKTNSKDFIGTVHSFTLLHVIQPFAHLFPKYGVKYPLKIIRREDENKIYHSVLSELKVDSKMFSLMDINKQRSLSLSGMSKIQFPSSDLVKRAALNYEMKLLATEYLDFTSIINISALIIHDQEIVRNALRSRFPWLLVDEYQDLGKALHEMVLELVFNADMKLFAVGDMNQSIYGFNGGYPDFLEELTKRDDINSISLSSNYRSSQHIITASVDTLPPSSPPPVYIAQGRKEEAADFTFITCDHEMEQQYQVVANEVIPLLIKKNVPLNEIGIITGSNIEVRFMALALTQNNIPFYVSKWSFENSAVVTWLQDCADWCTTKENQSFDNLFKTWRNLLGVHNDNRQHLDKINLKVAFYKALLKSKQKGNVQEWLTFILSELKLQDVLQDSEIYPNEIENLQSLLKEATLLNLKNTRLERFAHLGSPENEVTITTRHSAKGLEFEVVIMLGMEEGNFPYYTAIKNPLLLAEAKRLCYVCLSRAKKSCILLRSLKFTKNTQYGEKTFSYPASQFWNILSQKFGTADNRFTHLNYGEI